ncbi:FtsK/SpoIIIE domain-containing protein [Peribacillus frigoritolerans]|uniref:FtsK/SpoIIIE domain-containing protein n=1 Tax=Peribacillus frigoritolerans TaxID=450367 RepID=UPI003D056834
MIFETLSTIAFGSLAGYAYFKSEGPVTNDSNKILKIFNNAGFKIKEGKVTKTIRILRKKKIKGGMEYVFQLPLGQSSREIIAHKHVLEDGVNTRATTLKFNPRDLFNVKLDKTVLKQIKAILTEKEIVKKEMDIEADGGVLKIRVYNGPMDKKIIWNESMLKPDTWAVIVGQTRHETFYHDFDARKHLILAGATGGGKSVVNKLIITSLMLSKPDDVIFSLIDLKGGPAFARFKDCRQVKHFGINNKDAYDILQKVQADMERMYEEVLVPNGFEDVTEAGIKERHFIIIDEAADLVDHGPAMDILTDIVRKGRGAGFYVIYATQYPSAQAIPMQIKRNVPARLCFVLDSTSGSMTVLDAPGAEDLPEIPGRGIYKGIKQNVIQAPLLTNTKIEELIKPFKIIKKDDEHATEPEKPRKNTKHTIEFIETRLS